MVFDLLNEKNFFLYAAQHYNNPQCTGIGDFYDDLKTIKYIKRLLNRYINTGELKTRLIFNHIILLSNVFTPQVATRILFYKLEDEYWPIIKPFLLYLDYLPEVVEGVRKEGDIHTVDITLDQNVVTQLRNE